ncbi:GGDEF domain-containing protein [Longispora albida]|uniref:GGDEF domain-containing protein n=1 Tax=Longispora albida TaxID=203523 RepID=UPI000370934D|nr:GGDEF domain-containing protein [Longispora albida]
MSQLLTALGGGALGAATALALTIPDMWRQRRRLRAAHKEATHDPLTGVANRLGLAEAFEEAQSDGTPSVVVLDIDRFGTINKVLGHEAGDKLLAQVAVRLAALGLPVVSVARLGGDEFVLLVDAHIKQLPGGDPLAGPVWIRTNDADGVAVTAARDAWRAIAEWPFALDDGREVPITASFGVAVARPGDTLRQLLRRADLAMLAAKNTGASVRLAPPTAEPVLERPAVRDRDARHQQS